MKVKALKDFASNLVGNVKAGQLIEVSDQYAIHLCDYGLCVPDKTRAEGSGPLSNGGDKPLSSSPVAQALTNNRSNISESNEAETVAALSESTQQGFKSNIATQSTESMESGGKPTRRKRTRKKKE